MTETAQTMAAGAAPFNDTFAAENTSGKGKLHGLPAGVAGWSWGGFAFSWIWAVCNGSWLGLLALIPGIGLVVRIVLGINGREWAWRNKRWDSVEHFNRVQRRWSIAASLFLAVPLIGIVAAVVIPIYSESRLKPVLATAYLHADGAAAAVGQYIAEHRALPRSLQDTAFAAPLPPAIENVLIDQSTGHMKFTVNAGHLRGKAFYLAPTREADGTVSWRCLHGEIPKHLLPKQCGFNVADALAL